MTKTYNYKDLKFPVADETEVILEVKYISDGNSSLTVVNRPGEDDPQMNGPGKVLIGKGKDLRSETTYVLTYVDNVVPYVENIKLQYELNGKEVITHSNARSESKSPVIILHLKFPSA